MVRKKIGLFFIFNKIWIGGLIYIINVIKCLKELPDSQKPHLILFYEPDNQSFLKEIEEINYPYFEFVEFKLGHNRILAYIYSFVSQKNFFVKNIVEAYKLDGLFPLNDFPVKTRYKGCTLVSWFPDFQHKFYPQYFSRLNLLFRETRFDLVFKNSQNIVFSSHDVLSHYEKFKKPSIKTPTEVLQFVSVVHERQELDIEILKQKYGIHRPYFMVSNQFYQHKNHILIFKAIAHLKSKHPDLCVVLTGRMEDYRNPKFIEELKNFIKDNQLEANCIFLSVVPRDEQLCLMKNSIAVIQPSKFEGWSTVIEDAKSVQTQVISSDLPVHIEQMEDKGYYFGQDSVNELSELMEQYHLKTILLKPYFNNYNERMQIFATKFVAMFN